MQMSYDAWIWLESQAFKLWVVVSNPIGPLPTPPSMAVVSLSKAPNQGLRTVTNTLKNNICKSLWIKASAVKHLTKGNAVVLQMGKQNEMFEPLASWTTWAKKKKSDQNYLAAVFFQLLLATSGVSIQRYTGKQHGRRMGFIQR